MNTYSKLTFAAALTGAVSLFSMAQAADMQPQTSNALAAAVRSEINKDAALLADHLDIEAVDGVVYIRGTVDTDVEAADAGAAAIKAAGGAKVVNMTATVY